MVSCSTGGGSNSTAMTSPFDSYYLFCTGGLLTVFVHLWPFTSYLMNWSGYKFSIGDQNYWFLGYFNSLAENAFDLYIDSESSQSSRFRGAVGWYSNPKRDNEVRIIHPPFHWAPFIYAIFTELGKVYVLPNSTNCSMGSIVLCFHMETTSSIQSRLHYRCRLAAIMQFVIIRDLNLLTCVVWRLGCITWRRWCDIHTTS